MRDSHVKEAAPRIVPLPRMWKVWGREDADIDYDIIL